MRAPRKGLRIERCLSVLIAVLLAVPSNAAAQQPPSSGPAAPSPSVKNLRVVPLAGNGEMNDLERRVMAPLVVEVLDLQDRPIEGAEVVFRFPVKGPTAVFADQKSVRAVRTNGQGQAAATGWMANNEVGAFQVHVTASYGNQIGETTISMSNVARLLDTELNRFGKRKSVWSSKWVKIAIIAGVAGAGLGIYLGTRGGGSAAKTTTITISPGSPSVGGP